MSVSGLKKQIAELKRRPIRHATPEELLREARLYDQLEKSGEPLNGYNDRRVKILAILGDNYTPEPPLEVGSEKHLELLGRSVPSLAMPEDRKRCMRCLRVATIHSQHNPAQAYAVAYWAETWGIGLVSSIEPDAVVIATAKKGKLEFVV